MSGLIRNGFGLKDPYHNSKLKKTSVSLRYVQLGDLYHTLQLGLTHSFHENKVFNLIKKMNLWNVSGRK